jgi:hypothetical protein
MKGYYRILDSGWTWKALPVVENNSTVEIGENRTGITSEFWAEGDGKEGSAVVWQR